MAWWENLYIDDGKYSMIDVVIVYFASDALFAYMVDLFVDGLVDNG